MGEMLPAEWSLVDANQGYTGGVEWEDYRFLFETVQF